MCMLHKNALQYLQYLSHSPPEGEQMAPIKDFKENIHKLHWWYMHCVNNFKFYSTWTKKCIKAELHSRASSHEV